MRLISGPQNPLLPEIRQAAERHPGGRVQLTVAWANDEGAALLVDAVVSAVGDLDVLVGINNQGTTVEGLLRLLASANRLRVLYQHPMVTFHPKAYCFDDGSSGTLLIGSSNLTVGGLDTNFEASIVLELIPELRKQWSLFWKSFEEHAFSITIASPKDVERLYKGGYIALEATTRARRQRLLRSHRQVVEGDEGYPLDLPTEGPARRFRSTSPAIEIPFEIVEDPAEPPTEGNQLTDVPNESPPTPPTPGAVPSLAFVRTLTPNDIAKLRGDQSGTFEPDLGLAARDENQGFWGWPDAFDLVTRRLPRFERSETVSLFSRVTGPAGLRVDLVIWFREERAGHPAEFRLSPRPISTIRDAVSDDFDESSLLVVEKDNGAFVLRLVGARDPGYDHYVGLLSVVKPAHRYGYGTRP